MSNKGFELWKESADEYYGTSKHGVARKGTKEHTAIKAVYNKKCGKGPSNGKKCKCKCKCSS
jgi:hypothetical protein